MAETSPSAAITIESGKARHLGVGAALGLVGLCAIWGFAQVAIKVGNTGISPLLQASVRSAGAAILLLAWCRWRRIRLIERDGTGLPGIGAGLLFALEFLLLYWGLQYTNAARSVVFLNTSPFFVALGAHWLIRGERLQTAKIVGLIAAFAGVVIAFSDGLRLPSAHALIGDAMSLAAAIAWGATTVLIKASSLARIRPERTLMYQLAVSTLALWAASVAVGEPGFTDVTPLVAVSLAYQVIVVAFASYVIWFWYLAHYPASQVASFVFLSPLFGVAAGAWLLNDHISGTFALALLLIAAGIYVINRPGIWNKIR
jgi:drug/metabolite transporter (DMT)-like permease